MRINAGFPSMPQTALRFVRATALAALLSLSLVAHAQSSPPSLGELFPTGADGPNQALPAGTGLTVTTGSQLAAGDASAVLRLAPGGQGRLVAKDGTGRINRTAYGRPAV